MEARCASRGAEVISRIAKAVAAWEGLAFLLSLVLGVAVLAYVVATWVLHFARQGDFVLAAATLVTSVIAATLAALRVPLALLLVFGGAAVAGAALVFGAMDVLLP